MVSNDFLLELGSEEIPTSFIKPALDFLEQQIAEGLRAAGLGHGEIRQFGTPRRLAILIKSVRSSGATRQREAVGPPLRIARDAEGNWAPAALKFAEGLGISVDLLKTVQTSKGEYVGAEVIEKGQLAEEILPGLLNKLVHGIPFKKSMRWGDVEQSYPRPLHWIVALWGSEVIPVTFADVQSSRDTFGHRFLSPGRISLSAPSEWEPALKKNHVIPSIEERKALLRQKLELAARGNDAHLLVDDALEEQVVQLVELPCPVVGTFDVRHLDLPPEVLIQEMKGHQRYFSLVDRQGTLLPRFIAVSNTPVRDEELSVRGYQRVLRARLADGRFFFDQDRKSKLVECVPKLSKVVFQQKLGTYAEKIARISQLSEHLTEQAAPSKNILENVRRAALLCKADLVTGMVGEFPELQGVMGREYARASGEPEDVAVALDEHYWPRFSGDRTPQSDVGALIGLADRFDTLCGIFGIGKAPTGAADPFGLRRACLSIIHISLAKGYRF